jgi:hypothetical protein
MAGFRALPETACTAPSCSCSLVPTSPGAFRGVKGKGKAGLG